MSDQLSSSEEQTPEQKISSHIDRKLRYYIKNSENINAKKRHRRELKHCTLSKCDCGRYALHHPKQKKAYVMYNDGKRQHKHQVELRWPYEKPSAPSLDEHPKK
jgi:hypothetical protein